MAQGFTGASENGTVILSGDVTGSGTGAITTAIGSGVIVNADINASAAIDSTKIADGSISNTEFQYLNGVSSAIQTQLDGKQPLDSDLTTIAGLTATSDNFIQSKSSAWASRTPTQVTADLIVMVGDSGAGGSKGLVPAPTTGDATKYLRGDATWQTIPGGGDALTTNPLSQFAATTSLQLKGVISDETGSGALVFATSPALVTPDLGTPSAGTLTNCTGLPAAGLVASTTQAVGFGSIELGHASDTTIARVSAGVVSIEGVNIVTESATQTLTNKTLTSPTLTTPALGTPSAGTLTNCSGLPASGLVASTSQAVGFGSVELGHASDTTIARVSAGVISVEGVTVPTISSTSTLTNKRITKRIGTTASSSTPTPDADSHDIYTVTALAAGATFGAPTGTPTDGQSLIIRIKDNGTARTLAYNAIYRAIGVTLPTTTVISKTIYLGFIYNSADTKWDCIAVAQEA